MKLSKKLFLILLTTSILTMATVAYSATIWSDDFEDNNLDDWTTELLDWDLFDAFTGETVEFDLSEGTLKCPGDTPGNIWYLANHESTVEYGEWSFDVNIIGTPWEHFYVFIMTGDWEDYPSKAYGYDIVFSTEHGYPEEDSMGAVALFKRDGWKASWDTLDEWSTSEELTGWHTVKVTRDIDGVFDVYFDEELILHVEDEEPMSDFCTAFRFEAPSGVEIDDVVVSDLSVDEPDIGETSEDESTGGGIPGFPVMSLCLGLAVVSYLKFRRQETSSFRY